MKKVNIEIHESNGKKLVDARELYYFLEVTSKFADWIKNRIKGYDFIQDKDYVSFSKNLESGGQRKEYGLTIEMAKELAMVENNEKGQQARRYFINIEKEFKSLNPANLSKIQILQIALESETQRIELESQVKKLEPKAELADRIIATPDLIDIGQVSKVLELPIGRNNLFKDLRDRGILFKGKNEPKQEYIERGYFKLKEKLIKRRDHADFTVLTVLVTQKGLLWLSKLYKIKVSNKLAKIQA